MFRSKCTNPRWRNAFLRAIYILLESTLFSENKQCLWSSLTQNRGANLHRHCWKQIKLPLIVATAGAYFQIFWTTTYRWSILFSGRFDTSGSMIPLSVSEITGCDAFCDVQQDEELGILVVGLHIGSIFANFLTFGFGFSSLWPLGLTRISINWISWNFRNNLCTLYNLLSIYVTINCTTYKGQFLQDGENVLFRHASVSSTYLDVSPSVHHTFQFPLPLNISVQQSSLMTPTPQNTPPKKKKEEKKEEERERMYM